MRLCWDMHTHGLLGLMHGVAIHIASVQGDDTITSLTVDEAEVILIRHWYPTQLKFVGAIYSVGMTQLMQPLTYICT